jgi:glycosyltransferase involved in cell wall biosynthesis
MARVFLIGVRGIPNRYGGFERLVEVLAPHLARQGHEVTVFCEGGAVPPPDDLWHGVHRRFIPVKSAGPRGTLAYDWRSVSDVPRGAIALIFGYGTAVYQWRLRRRHVRHAVNMDGLEWQRQKWGLLARLWLRLNERAAVAFADELIADHPAIQSDLQRRLGAAATMIAYGVDLPALTAPAAAALPPGLPPEGYLLVIARPEPENQIHLLLQAHARSGSQLPLVVVGQFDANAYGRELRRQFPDVRFLGPIYDPTRLDALRRQCLLYLHGHSVGGTNPSLIEAMAAGAPVVAHDNPFNRWVLGDRGGWYFGDVEALSSILASPPSDASRLAAVAAARQSCQDRFLWADILAAYGEIVDRLVAPSP